MRQNLLLWLCVCLCAAMIGTAIAKDKPASPGRKPSVKQLSGMSIVGNDEAPKSLYIVPWKTSEMGAETSFNMMLTESAVPVDREEFTRQVEFYEMSTKK